MLRGFPGIAFLLTAVVAFSSSGWGQQAERTLDEIKAEAVHRAEVGGYPLIGIDPADVQEAFKSIHTRNPDEWATAFMNVAGKYENEAKSLEKTDPATANADYIRAWRLYSFGRWPYPSSPKKQESYEKAIEMFLAHARFYDTPLEVVHIPFDGKEVIAYLRLPKNPKGRVPLVIAVNGPGTGQSPIKVDEHADRILSAVLDYVGTRPEIDKDRVAFHGVSWGAYWATKMAILEKSRLRGASAQSPPVEEFFQPDFLRNSLLGNREYLFDQVPALMAIYNGVSNIDQLEAMSAKMSLVKQGLLAQPMAPMLILAGINDTQVPISDIWLLLSKGDTPKTAWINPAGGHLGRQVKVWPDPRIFNQVIIPWLVRTLQAPGV